MHPGHAIAFGLQADQGAGDGTGPTISLVKEFTQAAPRLARPRDFVVGIIRFVGEVQILRNRERVDPAKAAFEVWTLFESPFSGSIEHVIGEPFMEGFSGMATEQTGRAGLGSDLSGCNVHASRRLIVTKPTLEQAISTRDGLLQT